MDKKIIAPAALNALKEALTNVYWYKSRICVKRKLIKISKDIERILGFQEVLDSLLDHLPKQPGEPSRWSPYSGYQIEKRLYKNSI